MTRTLVALAVLGGLTSLPRIASAQLPTTNGYFQQSYPSSVYYPPAPHMATTDGTPLPAHMGGDEYALTREESAPAPSSTTVPDSTATKSGCDNCGHCSECMGGGIFSGLRAWWMCRAKPSLQESHWGYPEYFHEAPFGASVRAHMGTQVRKGIAAQLVLYQYDFTDVRVSEGNALRSKGMQKLYRLSEMLQFNAGPLIIEASGYAELDNARRTQVINELHRMDVPVPEEMVVVAHPRIKGLRAEEAVQMDNILIQQTQNQGAQFRGISSDIQ